MAFISVKCPDCKQDNVIKFGTNATGKQRYQCKNTACSKDTFLVDYSRNADYPEVKQQIIDMAINGSGIRDTARVLGISTSTVLATLKKRKQY